MNYELTQHITTREQLWIECKFHEKLIKKITFLFGSGISKDLGWDSNVNFCNNSAASVQTIKWRKTTNRKNWSSYEAQNSKKIKTKTNRRTLIQLNKINFNKKKIQLNEINFNKKILQKKSEKTKSVGSNQRLMKIDQKKWRRIRSAGFATVAISESKMRSRSFFERIQETETPKNESESESKDREGLSPKSKRWETLKEW